MGNQQATLNWAIQSVPLNRAGLLGIILGPFPHSADSRKPSEAIRSPPYPIKWKGEEMVQTTT